MVKSSAPGSLMLMGEHAVLHGYRCLVTAVSARMHVELTPQTHDRIHLESALGTYTSTIQQLSVKSPFEFVLTALKHYQAAMPSGCSIRITSEFSNTVGLASSAAITVAIHHACMTWIESTVSKDDLFDRSLTTIRAVQGMGSGADAAAAVWGGTVLYRASPREIVALPPLGPIAVVYSGSKTPTPVVVAQVDKARALDPARFDHLFSEIDGCVEQAVEAVRRGDQVQLGQHLNANQELMDALGVNTDLLADIVSRLRAIEGITGSKISGSGLGDCVIGLGSANLKDWPEEVLTVSPSAEGVAHDRP